jgi:hypothetical protein
MASRRVYKGGPEWFLQFDAVVRPRPLTLSSLVAHLPPSDLVTKSLSPMLGPSTAPPRPRNGKGSTSLPPPSAFSIPPESHLRSIHPCLCVRSSLSDSGSALSSDLRRSAFVSPCPPRQTPDAAHQLRRRNSSCIRTPRMWRPSIRLLQASNPTLRWRPRRRRSHTHLPRS